MVSYKISVKTGDKKGAGTDANVYIILHGKGPQTSKYNLDTFFKNDFEQGSIDDYTVDSDVNIPEVQRIELWRDNYGLFSNWYLDWIEVTNVESGITSIFPAMKWIKADHHYIFNHIDTCLPQDDPFKQKRMLELQTIKKDYQLQVKVPGLPAQVKDLPDDESFSFDYKFNIGKKLTIFALESKKLVMANGFNWKDADDVKTVYTPIFGVPENSEYFNDDADFGRQRLASLNSLLITLCTAIPEKFGVTEEMVKPFLEGKTIEEAMKEKRLFIIDLALLEGCPAKTEDLVITCPFSLFYFNNANHLMPIAIQLFQQKGTDNPVFLPSDPEYTWMMAKMWYNLAEAHYHQALTHLNLTHFMMEGICVATKRNLSPSHPICRLLTPHFMYLIAINFLGLGTLINPGGLFDKTSSGGINGAFFLMRKSMEFWRLDTHGTLPENLKSRGVLDQSVLKDAYHMRDDALLLYDAIKTYVQNYVTHYYSVEGSLKADYEIQNWGAEIVKSRDDGGVGILVQCRPGYFGRNCSQSCEGCISDLCERYDGFCDVTGKCKPGYIHDSKCNQSCDSSYYGNNCTEQCNCLISSEPCNKTTGMCPGGKCDKGWSGESCNAECKEGYYGFDCMGYCNNCLNTSCEIFEGNCTFGCINEFSGPQCREADFQRPEGPSLAFIGGVCAAVFCVILVVIFLIVYRRFFISQKQGNHRYVEEQNKICSSPTNQRDIYENVKGNFTSAENIRLSFTVKRDRKISIDEISSNDLPDEEEEVDVNVYGNVISEDDICQYKIRIEDLANVIIEKRHDKGFEKEYTMFPKGLIHAHIEGSKEENKAKNRFLTTWPYDHSRIVLKGDTNYDYINANYIDSYHKQKAYIATQGPKRNTLRDFWHMVWQENVCKIVMVTELEENGKKKCYQYWPQIINDPLILDCYTLTMQEEQENSEYVYRLIKVKHKKATEGRKVHHYHFTQWPDHGVPDSIKLVNFYRAVKNDTPDQQGPLLVHCSAGIGRTGTFIAIDSLYEHGKSIGYVDIVEYVKMMRKDRLNMIQTFEQYEAVFEALQELFTVPDTSIPVQHFCKHFDKQDNMTVPRNQNVYRLEFQRLQSLCPSYSADKNKAAKLKENVSKNAVNEILPHDEYRPYLMSFGKNRNDYINAVMIPGYSSDGSFLVTQCPLKETVVDFWTMVYDHDSSIVVLLDTLNEDAPLWSSKDKTLELEGFDIDLDLDKTPEGVKLTLVHGKNQPDKRSIFVFYAKEFENGSPSLPSTTDMIVLLERVTEQRKQRTGPVTVVCRNGATKSGLFVAISLILDKMKIDDRVDVFQVIRTMQLRRPEFLSNFDQYEYCYKCIKYFIEQDSVYANL